MFKKIIILCGILFLCACDGNGPKQALNNTAKALEAYNPQEFLQNFDLKLYTSNHIEALTQNDRALNMLNSFGNALGLGGIDSLINSFMDVQEDIKNNFNMGVSTGELMADCREGDSPLCPWVPQSLRDATITEVGENGAIAKVTTPAKLTCWLALRKVANSWLIIGLAPLESQAREFASSGGKAAQPPAKAPAAPKTKTPSQVPTRI